MLLTMLFASTLLGSVQTQSSSVLECATKFENIDSIDGFKRFLSDTRESGRDNLDSCLKSYSPFLDLDSLDKIISVGKNENVCRKDFMIKLADLDKQLVKNSMGSKGSRLNRFLRLYIGEVILTCKRLLVNTLENVERNPALLEALIQVNNFAQNFIWYNRKVKSLVLFDRMKKPEPQTIVLFNPKEIPNLRALSCMVKSARHDLHDDGDREPIQIDEKNLGIYDVVTHDDLKDLKNDKKKPIMDVEFDKAHVDTLTNMSGHLCEQIKEHFTNIVAAIRHIRLLGHNLNQPELDGKIESSRYLNLWTKAGDICSALSLVKILKQSNTSYQLSLLKDLTSRDKEVETSDIVGTIGELKNGAIIKDNYSFDSKARDVSIPAVKIDTFYSTFYSKNFLETLTYYIKMTTAVDMAHQYKTRGNSNCQ